MVAIKMNNEISKGQMRTRLAVINDHYKETMFRDGLPPLGIQAHDAQVAAIRSLIESSGDKEQETDPFLSNLYGVKSAPSPAPTIKKDVTVGPSIPERIKELMVYVAHWQTTRDMKKFPWTEEDKKAFGEVLCILQRSLPVPLPKEVEEAMEKIITRLEGRDCSEEIVFIKAALQPKVVSREWVDDLSARIDKIQFVTCPNDATLDTVERTIDELGIEVGEKP